MAVLDPIWRRFFGTSVTTHLIHSAYLGTPGGYLGSYQQFNLIGVKPRQRAIQRGEAGAAAAAGQEMADVAVVLFDGKGQVLAGKVPVLQNDPVVSLPVAGEEGPALDPDLVEEPPEGFVVTATQYPGNGAAGDGVIRAPNPEFPGFFRENATSRRT